MAGNKKRDEMYGTKRNKIATGLRSEGFAVTVMEIAPNGAVYPVRRVACKWSLEPTEGDSPPPTTLEGPWFVMPDVILTKQP